MSQKSDDMQLMGLRLPNELMKAIDRQAADEGISRSDVVRRGVMYDLRRRQAPTSDQNSGTGN